VNEILVAWKVQGTGCSLFEGYSSEALSRRLKLNVTKLCPSQHSSIVVGQAILPSASVQAARSDDAGVFAHARRRLKGGGSQNWLPHKLCRWPIASKLYDIGPRLPFSQIMNKIVPRKLGMKHSTYEQPLPADLAATAATGHRANGNAITGKWHTYPEMAAAGLWTTPSDLALFAIEPRKPIKGASNQVLERTMANDMVKRQFEEYGLGLHLASKGFDHGGGKLIDEIIGAIEAEYLLKR
jgi:Beta-lactamase